MSKLNLSDKVGIVTIGDTFRYLVTFLLGVFLVRILSKEEYGTYQQAFLIVWTLIGFIHLGLPSSIYYFFPRLSHEEREVFFKQTVFLLLIFGIIAYSLLCCLSSMISTNFHNPALRNILPVFGLYLFPTLILSCVGPVLICLNKHKIYAVFTVLSNLFTTLLILLVAFFKKDINLILWLIVCGTLINSIIILYYLKKIINYFGFSWNLNLLSAQFRYSLPLGMSGIVSLVGKEIDKFLISIFFLADIFATYNVGAIEIPFITIFFTSLDCVALPELSVYFNNNQKHEMKLLWNEMIRKMSIIVIPLFFYLFLLASKIIIFLYTDKYYESAAIFKIYLLILPLRIARFSVILQAIGKSSVVLKGTILYLFLSVLLNTTLIKTIGFTGPAWATFIGTLLLIVYYVYSAKKSLMLRISELYPWSKITIITFCSIVASIVTYPFLYLRISNIAILFLTSIFFSVTYFFTIYKTQLLMKADIEFIKRCLNVIGIYKSLKIVN